MGDYSDNDECAPIPNDTTRKEIFESLLEYAYTVKTPETSTEAIATELLLAADLFECIQLKLYAESVLVDKFLRGESAARLLILADSHSCALLKEAATNLIVAEADLVEKTEDWRRVDESAELMRELYRASRAGARAGERAGGTTGGVDGMDVTRLRETLQQANLEVDG